jgi:membrane protein DedA with SNARE-associated domain
MQRLQDGLANAALPLCLGLVVLIAGLAHLVLPVPSIPALFAALKGFFHDYGIPALLLSAFLEGLFVFSFYVPGSLVIVFGVILAADAPERLIAIGIACWVGVTLAMIVDYAIGRFGLHRLFSALGGDAAVAGTQAWMEKWGRAAIFLAAVHPNLLALVVVCAGIARAPFGATIGAAAAASALWIPLVLLVAWSVFRAVDLGEADPLPVVLGLFALWAVALFIRGFHRSTR